MKEKLITVNLITLDGYHQSVAFSPFLSFLYFTFYFAA
jgi:hypothetical protein